MQNFDSSYFRDKNHFGDDGIPNYLVFQPMYKYFKTINSTDNISEWKSKGLSKLKVKSIIVQINMMLVSINMVLNVEHHQDFGKIKEELIL